MDYHFLSSSVTLSLNQSIGFNPCFNGLSFLIAKNVKLADQVESVSILVLMDYHFLFIVNDQSPPPF